jgi:murein L,D-transpeptidase YafK
LLISSPVGTGLVRGNKSKEGDNKTPVGTYVLGTPE